MKCLDVCVMELAFVPYLFGGMLIPFHGVAIGTYSVSRPPNDIKLGAQGAHLLIIVLHLLSRFQVNGTKLQLRFAEYSTGENTSGL